MPIYSKPSAELVYDLINEANPDLDPPLSPANVTLGDPTVITPVGGAIQNARIPVRATLNSPYIGRDSLTYRRIALGSLFRGMLVQINKYSTKLPGSGSNTVMFTLYELLADINAKYGMSFTQDDLSDISITRGNTQDGNGNYYRDITVNAKAGSKAFTGSFTFRWVQAAQDISTMITVVNIPGRLFPGGNTFDENHLKAMNSWQYGFDYTDKMFELATAWNKSAFARVVVASNSTLGGFYQWLIGQINAQLGTSLVWDNTFYTAWYHSCYVLPDTSLPEANGRYHNRVVVLETPAAGSKGVIGKIFIHFTV